MPIKVIGLPEGRKRSVYVRLDLSADVDADHTQDDVHYRLPRLLVLLACEIVRNRREELAKRLDERLGVACEKSAYDFRRDVDRIGRLLPHIDGGKVLEERVLDFKIGKSKRVKANRLHLSKTLYGEIACLK